MTLRVFRTTFLVAIDDVEAREEGDRKSINPVTLQELKGYLNKALRLDVDIEYHGNEIGFQSAEAHIDNLVELPFSEVVELYYTHKV